MGRRAPHWVTASLGGVLASGLVFSGCIDTELFPPEEFDGQPPLIVAVQSGLIDLCNNSGLIPSCIDPAAQGQANVSTTDAVRIFFSEPIDPSTIIPDTAMLVDGPVDQGFLSDADSPPLSDSRRELLHPVLLELEGDGSILKISPLRPLKEQSPYTLLLSTAIRDQNGAPLVDALGLARSYSLSVVTGDLGSGSPIASLVFPAAANGQAEAQNVPTNVPRAVLRFSKRVSGVTTPGQVLLLGGDEAPVPFSLVDGLTLGLPECAGALLSQCFSLEIQAELQPNSSQQIILGDGITDVTLTQALVEPKTFRFSTGAGPDDLAPNFLTPPEVAAQDISATVTFVVDEAGSGTVRFGRNNVNENSLTTQVTDLGGGSFRHQATLNGLTAETNFVFEVLVSDFAGNTNTDAGSFTTAPPLPALAISEVFANPGASSETTEEFIEIVNEDVLPIDLAGFALQRIQNGSAVATLPIANRGAGTILQPGEFAIAVGSSFAPAAFTPAGLVVAVVSGTGTQVNLSLSNSTDQSYTLVQGGFVIDTFTNFIDHECNGQSVERINLALGDVVGNYAYSGDVTGATAGRANSGSTEDNVCAP